MTLSTDRCLDATAANVSIALNLRFLRDRHFWENLE